MRILQKYCKKEQPLSQVNYFGLQLSEELISNKTTQGSVQVSQPSVAHSTTRITGHHTANQVTERVCVLSSDTRTNTHTYTH